MTDAEMFDLFDEAIIEQSQQEFQQKQKKIKHRFEQKELKESKSTTIEQSVDSKSVEIEPYSVIFTDLYLGDAKISKDKEALKKLGIYAIVNAAKELYNNFPDDFEYMRVPIEDKATENISKYFFDTHKFINKHREEGRKVLVHCQKGVSRSATIVIAYLIRQLETTYNNAFWQVKNKRSIIRPNSGFKKQLREYDEILRSFDDEDSTPKVE